MDVVAWLRGLGLEQYAPPFRDNDIDDAVLRQLTAEDLRELGVASVGHRRRLLDAIAAFGAPPHPRLVRQDCRPKPPQTLAPKGDAERRQLTVMFCDLVGSTALSPGSTRRICARSSAVLPRRRQMWPASTVRSPSTWATAYSSTSAIRRPEDAAARAVRAGLAPSSVRASMSNP